jgi:serine/threonine protein kinase
MKSTATKSLAVQFPISAETKGNQNTSSPVKIPKGAVRLPRLEISPKSPSPKATQLSLAAKNKGSASSSSGPSTSAQAAKPAKRLGVAVKGGGLPSNKLSDNPDAVLQSLKVPPEFKKAVVYMARHFACADATDRKNHAVHLNLRTLMQDAYKTASSPSASPLASGQSVQGKITPISDLIAASQAMITDGPAREIARAELEKFEKAGAFTSFVPTGLVQKSLITQAASRTGFEHLLDPNDYKLDHLPKSIRETPPKTVQTREEKTAQDFLDFDKFMKDLTGALKKGGTRGATAVQNLAPRLAKIIEAKTDKSTQFTLAASDGTKFVDSLIAEAQKNVGYLGRGAAASTLRKLNETPGWQTTFHHRSLDGVGDSYKTYSVGEGLAAEPSEIKVGGHEYKLGPRIGGGQFGAAYRYISKTNSMPDLVVKVPNSEDKINGPLREARALIAAMGTGSAQAPIVSLTTVIRTKDSVLLVMPLAKFGSAETSLDYIDADTALTAAEKVSAKLTLFLDLLTAVERLQLATGQIHFDIALRNLLIDETGTALLADFGLSKDLKLNGAKSKNSASFDSKTASDRAPIKWSSPERLQKQVVTAASDVWSLGITLQTIVYGQHEPYPDLTNREAGEMYLEFDPTNRRHLPVPNTAKWPGVASDKVHALMSAMLQREPKNRASVSDLIQALKRDFPDVGSTTIRQKLVTSLGKPLPPRNPPLSNPPPSGNGQQPTGPYSTRLGGSPAKNYGKGFVQIIRAQ